MKHIARKRFGQHFLTDGGIIDAIVDAIHPEPGQHMVEIGPGLAALTQPLVERLGHLTVIELDRDLAVRLREHPHLSVVESDVLKVDFRALASHMLASAQTPATSTAKIRVVGNLPYNISTPILFHLLDQVDVIEDQHFMLQKEVIDRMVAQPATSDYSRLSVMLQWRYDMANVLFVPPESFDPPPSRHRSTSRPWRPWCRWHSASAARFCATPWANGSMRKALQATSTCSAALKRCPWPSLWLWLKLSDASGGSAPKKKPVVDGLFHGCRVSDRAGFRQLRASNLR